MSQTKPDPRAERLHAVLTSGFAPDVLFVQNDSARHEGHAGAGPGGQSHYSVTMVAACFRGQSRVDRSRAVHEAVRAEFGEPEAGGLHALALTLRTPEEHAAAAVRR